MPERVAIIGSRAGADLQQVDDFVYALRSKHPGTIVVSGGASGVDKLAETTWLSFGGRVESYRPVIVRDSYGIEKWELGGDQQKVYVMAEEPTFENFKSAALYRDMLIAEVSDRVVAFFRSGYSRGAGFTKEIAEGYGRPTYEYMAA